MRQNAAFTVLTVGHSNRSFPTLMRLLRSNDVTAVADIRSVPYSRLHPEFNRESLRKALESEGIRYVFLGEELGARPKDPSCYEDGRVIYDKLAQVPLFKKGLARIMKGAISYRIVLLCAENDPLFCHRSLLVARELENAGAKVIHIHSDGLLEAQGEAMDRLLTMHKLDRMDMLRDRQDAIREACIRQEERIAFRGNASIKAGKGVGG